MSDFRLKMIFGFSLVGILAILAGIIALGKVEPMTSHGLDIVLGALAANSGGFAQWAFSQGGKQEKNGP
jgi:hypothetical protein